MTFPYSASHKILLLALLLWPLAPWAQSTVFEEAGRIPDVRVLIDVSGSMKQNDPRNLRRPALELLVQLFPEQARAGVWTFGQWVNMLVPHGVVDPAWRAQAMAAAPQINSVALFTNIPEALARALDDLDQLQPDYRTSVILLTDGMVDVSKDPAVNRAARERLLKELLPRLREAGVTVYSVALSPHVDRELLERLALDTGGLFAVASTADELSQVFLRAFDAAAPAEQIPLEGRRFLIDAGVDEFTLLAFRDEGADSVLLAPDGQRLTAASTADGRAWFRGQSYDLVTVRKPLAGEWEMQSELQPGSRVTVVSDLNLAVKRLPQNLFAGDTPALTIALTEQGEVITNPDFLGVVSVGLDVQRSDDDQAWSDNLSAVEPSPADGLWQPALVMFDKAGVYDLRVSVDGKTFQRQQRQTVTVRERFELAVDDSEAPVRYRVSLQINNPELDVDATQVVATLRDPENNTTRHVLPGDADRRWQLVVDEALAAPGMYQVVFAIDGVYRSGDRFVRTLEPVLIPHGELPQPVPADDPPAADIEAQPEPAAEAEPEVAPEPTPATPAAEPLPDGGGDNSKYLLYGGLAFVNLCVLGLGFMAYRMVMASGQSSVLEESDDEDVEDAASDGADGLAAAVEGLALDDLAMTDGDDSGPEDSTPDAELLDLSDLPDDAIDIDSDTGPESGPDKKA